MYYRGVCVLCEFGVGLFFLAEGGCVVLYRFSGLVVVCVCVVCVCWCVCVCVCVCVFSIVWVCAEGFAMLIPMQ